MKSVALALNYSFTPALCAAALAVALLCFALPARAEGLTGEQLSNVQQLLSSYGVGAEKIKMVSGILSQDSSVSTTQKCPVPLRALVRGAQGDDVKQLQQRLSDEGLLGADGATGFFGSTTEAAVKAWQAREGLVATGTPATTGWGAVGKMTIEALKHGCGQVEKMQIEKIKAASSTPPMRPKHPMPPPAPQSSSGVFQFLSDYSDSFNQNLSAVAAAPFEVYVPILSNYFSTLGLY